MYLIGDARFGPLAAQVEEQPDLQWRASLVDRHPRLAALRGACGDSREQALSRLARAVEQAGSDWPQPPRVGVTTHNGVPYTPAPLPPPEVLVTDDAGRERRGYAVGWRDAEVWVCWHDGGLDATAWVSAHAVARITDDGSTDPPGRTGSA